MRTLIVGCGYLGRRVGRILHERGDTVLGSVRQIDRGPELEPWGITPVRIELREPASLDRLPPVDRLVFCVSPRRGEPAGEVLVDGLHAVLERVPGRVVLTSTTGVYGQTDGSWVDEATPAEPRTDSGRINLEAERLLGTFVAQRGTSAVILRLGGLYGPGRLIRRASLERGEPVPGDPEHWLNLIHVDDAARFVAAALEHPAPGLLYTATDDRPVQRRELYDRLARLLGVPEPVFAPDEAPAQRDSTNKRVSNRRIKFELNLACRYPDITTGLPAALASS